MNFCLSCFFLLLSLLFVANDCPETNGNNWLKIFARTMKKKVSCDVSYPNDAQLMIIVIVSSHIVVVENGTEFQKIDNNYNCSYIDNRNNDSDNQK